MSLLIIIGNKNYSSWSLRAWLGLQSLELPFKEQRIPLDQPQTEATLAKQTPAGKVPVLIDCATHGGVTVHDSLAILEYLHERYGHKLLPEDVRLRAEARSVSAEMHSGFSNLRAHLPMNLARRPAPPRDPKWLDAGTLADIRRICGMWEALRGANDAGGPFLFGHWSMADAMYLPVATRFRTYAIDLTQYPRAEAYAAHLLSLPAYLQWEAAAIVEPEQLPSEER